MKRYSLIIAALFLPIALFAIPSLRNNLEKAEKGDYIVASQNKNFILMRVAEKQDKKITIEEITIPQNRKDPKRPWKEWMHLGAPQNTSWVFYNIGMQNGAIIDCYSFSRKEWGLIPKQEQFLSILLNLPLTAIPEKERRKVGPPPADGSPDWRTIWQPKLIFEGRVIPNVAFTGWTTQWPNDGGDLSGKTVELFLPEENDKYPIYFPFWLQVRGKIGKATVHIVDSGKNMLSPINPPKR